MNFKHYKSTEVDRRTWLHVPSGTPWSTSTHQVVEKRMVLTLEQMQVPNGTGPGVRRSKRPLLASRTRCYVLWKPPKLCNKVKIGNKIQFGNKFANW